MKRERRIVAEICAHECSCVARFQRSAPCWVPDGGRGPSRGCCILILNMVAPYSRVFLYRSRQERNKKRAVETDKPRIGFLRSFPGKGRAKNVGPCFVIGIANAAVLIRNRNRQIFRARNSAKDSSWLGHRHCCCSRCCVHDVWNQQFIPEKLCTTIEGCRGGELASKSRSKYPNPPHGAKRWLSPNRQNFDF